MFCYHHCYHHHLVFVLTVLSKFSHSTTVHCMLIMFIIHGKSVLPRSRFTAFQAMNKSLDQFPLQCGLVTCSFNFQKLSFSLLKFSEVKVYESDSEDNRKQLQAYTIHDSSLNLLKLFLPYPHEQKHISINTGEFNYVLL